MSYGNARHVLVSGIVRGDVKNKPEDMNIILTASYVTSFVGLPVLSICLDDGILR
jgi:hypothetical protein